LTEETEDMANDTSRLPTYTATDEPGVPAQPANYTPTSAN
jgi:hypothetical protein